MGKSIIDGDAERCFICGAYKPLEAHHIFHGTARRKLADKDGMIVHVCPACHRKIHQDTASGLDQALKAWAEYEWMNHYEKTEADFISRYGKSYITEDENGGY